MKTVSKVVSCFYGSSFEIEVKLTMKQINEISQGGRDSLQFVDKALRTKLVKSQLGYWETMKDKIARELSQEGGEFETSDHKENIKTLIWMAACNYKEEEYEACQLPPLKEGGFSRSMLKR